MFGSKSVADCKGLKLYVACMSIMCGGGINLLSLCAHVVVGLSADPFRAFLPSLLIAAIVVQHSPGAVSFGCCTAQETIFPKCLQRCGPAVTHHQVFHGSSLFQHGCWWRSGRNESECSSQGKFDQCYWHFRFLSVCPDSLHTSLQSVWMSMSISSCSVVMKSNHFHVMYYLNYSWNFC